MTAKKIFLTAFIFAAVPIPYSIGQEAPLRQDVKYDDVQANPDDYKSVDVDKDKVPPKVMLANCSQPSCPQK